MNELMEPMNTSSGLSFSLRWTSKKAEIEKQLDTKDPVDILKQEGSLFFDGIAKQIIWKLSLMKR